MFSTPSLLSGLLDSNQRPRAPQTCALPTALNPDPFLLSTDLLLSNAGAKVHSFCEIAKFFRNFFANTEYYDYFCIDILTII